VTARSFRSRLLVGSILWTMGVLLVVAAGLVLFLATHPRPHVAAFDWFISVPLAVSGLLGLFGMATGAAIIWRGLQAVALLRVRLGDVHDGRAARLSGHYPAEIQPLADDLNLLLAARDDRVARAAARAADLAHGLKTPLAVLGREVDRVADCDPALAASLSGQITRMARHIDYHLSQARVVAAGSASGVSAPVAAAVEGLFRALGRLHAERHLTFEHAVAADHAVRCAPHDLDEMLGNLLDNACTWGRTHVRVASSRQDEQVRITVDDDGQGLDPALIPRVLERGGRADQRVPGTGLGLAIVHDLAALYGGSLALERSPLGGLRVSLTLPSVAG
jgi:signal transduction histidine kinase